MKKDVQIARIQWERGLTWCEFWQPQHSSRRSHSGSLPCFPVILHWPASGLAVCNPCDKKTLQFSTIPYRKYSFSFPCYYICFFLRTFARIHAVRGTARYIFPRAHIGGSWTAAICGSTYVGGSRPVRSSPTGIFPVGHPACGRPHSTEELWLTYY